ncbi:MAG: BatD family protein [Jhaorihella sp.]
MMRRWLLPIAAALALLAGAALAQDDPRPILRSEMPEGPAIVGQPLVLRLTVLVPTWMPKPPEYPSFEVANLMVHLPERATNPVSDTIGGETWSGTTRGYRLYPLEPGAFEIPAQTMTVTYADPDTTQPVTLDLPVAAVRFEAVLPKEAEGLDPPIVAQRFTLDQTLAGDTGLTVGGALTRTVTATIEGTTPVLIPQLIETPEAPGTPGPLRAYPDEPKVAESETRGTLSGSRSETVSYVAQAGGSAELPEIRLDWFNLETGSVETATLAAIRVEVAMPPPPPPDPLAIALKAAATLVAALLAYLVLRRVSPRIASVAAELRGRWLNSERRAHRTVLHAFKSHDIGQVLAALNIWNEHHPAPPAEDAARLARALAPLGKARYGATGQAAAPSDWRGAEAAYRRLRSTARHMQRPARPGRKLPALNPMAGSRPIEPVHGATRQRR